MPTLSRIAPELVRDIGRYLNSDDFVALYQVSREYHRYFTGSDTVEWAHKLFFPSSYGKLRKQGLEYKPEYFNMEYARNLRWKTNSPVRVCSYGSMVPGAMFVVSHSTSQLIYERSRGQIVVKDIGANFAELKENIINLDEVLCMLLPQVEVGERLRLYANRGVLLVVGHSHGHDNMLAVGGNPIPAPPPAHCQVFSSVQRWLYDLFYGHDAATIHIGPPIQNQGTNGAVPPHTQCAVFSLEQKNLGQLLGTWHERGSFNEKAALNEYYVIGQFDAIEKRLHGYIFPRDGNSRHRFVLQETALRQIGTALAADTQGKVLYVAYMAPEIIRFPVVEVHAIPVADPVTGSWSEPSIIKRVVLRCLVGPPPGNLIGDILWYVQSNRLVFGQATTAGLEGYNARGVKERRGVGEEMIQLKLFKDSEVGEAKYNMVSWNISARPSPTPPSDGTSFNGGIHWAPGYTFDENESPWASANGEVDLDEVYPKPAYHKFYDPESNKPCTLASTIDVDRYEGRGQLVRYPTVGLVDATGCRYFSVFYGENPRSMLSQFPNSRDQGWLVCLEAHSEHPYPAVPGVNDKRFVPLGEYFDAPTVEMRFTTGGTKDGVTIPPLTDEEPHPIGIDHENHRYIVYYTSGQHRVTAAVARFC